LQAGFQKAFWTIMDANIDDVHRGDSFCRSSVRDPFQGFAVTLGGGNPLVDVHRPRGNAPLL
jgi:preprotein translocase subunit SecD